MARKIWVQGEQVKSIDLNESFYFGGDGSDGALAISSGATVLDLSGTAVFTKNYSSISITGTGSLTFINPHSNGTVIILRSSGDVTMTSTAIAIDVSKMGASVGKNAQQILDTNNHIGGTPFGTGGANSEAAQNGGYGGVQLSFLKFYSTSFNLYNRNIIITCGSGGQTGATAFSGAGIGGVGGSGGSGGVGGGALLIECAGKLDFTSSISVAGSNGGNGSNAPTATNGGAGGGGSGGSGGVGGSCIILYNLLTTNTGSINIQSGIGGDGGAGGDSLASGNTGGGGGAASYGGSGSYTNAGNGGADGSTGYANHPDAISGNNGGGSVGGSGSSGVGNAGGIVASGGIGGGSIANGISIVAKNEYLT